MIINPYAFGVAFDADAQAFITASGISDSTQQNAINTLVTDLKGYGIWTKMKAIYPFVGGTASTHKWNLKDPRDLDAAFRLTFYGGWTHSSTGADPNGTTGYADTFVSNNLMGQNNISIGTYLGEDNPGDASSTCAIGSYNSGLGTCIYPGTNSQNSFFSINNSSTSAYYNTDSKSRGFYLVSKTSTNSFFSIRGNITNFTFTPSTNITTSFKLNKLGEFSGDYNSQQQRFAYIGDGLTSSEASALNTAVQSFETTLGRQV